MNKIYKGLLLLTSVSSFHCYADNYFAVVAIPETTIVSYLPETETIEPVITVERNATNQLIGTFTVENDQLDTTTLINSSEGCSVELDTTDGTDGSWSYINDNSCSDDDTVTFSSKKGVNDVTIVIWDSSNSCDTTNDWLNAASSGYEGLKYNRKSCTINDSDIRSLVSFNEVPAQYLNSVFVSLLQSYDGGDPVYAEGGEGQEEGLETYYFLLPDVKYIWGDLFVEHFFLTELDLSDLQYVGGDINLIKLDYIESIDLSSLKYDVSYMSFEHSFSLTNLNIENLQGADYIDLSYTSISDISKFKSLKYAEIISDYITLSVFPERYSNFCGGIRNGNITITPYSNWSAAYDACK